MTRGPKQTTARGRKAGARELRAWLSADEYARWVAAAESAGMTLGDFIRSLTPTPAGSPPHSTATTDAPRSPGAAGR
jgi:hypothetical protein